ncbi:MAG TPA: DoxX family protein [Polyangiales bacterium]
MATIASRSLSHERLLHFSTWVAQDLLAFFFTVTASLKLLLDDDRLVEIMAWTESLPRVAVRGFGVIELLGAIAVAAPAVTRAPQRIVGYAALGFLTLMASAMIIHIARGEYRMVALNLAVGMLAAFVAWGRLLHSPIER